MEKGDSMKNEFYSISDCSRLLGGVAEHRINYAHRTGKISEPKLRVAGKRIYSAAELKGLAHYFGVTLDSATKGESCLKS
jgi:hypothetical protein